MHLLSLTLEWITVMEYERRLSHLFVVVEDSFSSGSDSMVSSWCIGVILSSLILRWISCLAYGRQCSFSYVTMT